MPVPDAPSHHTGPVSRDPIRAGRQYPYRGEPDDPPEVITAIRRTAGEAIEGVDRMIHKQVRRRFPDADNDAREEIVQKCRIWLWQKSLPKYDAWREPPVKLTTFLYECIRKFVAQSWVSTCRERARRRPRAIVATADITNLDLAGGEHRLDRRVEAIAERVLTSPHAIFTPAQAAVLEALLNNPGVAQGELDA